MNAAIEMALNGALSTCQECAKPFAHFTLRRIQMCPTCADVAQGRTSVVVERLVLQSFDYVRVTSLPGEWEKFVAADGDSPVWRITVKGSEFGAAWQGRIDLYTPWEGGVRVGDVVRVRHMRATHKVRTIYTDRATRHGVVTHRAVLPITDTIGEEELERHEYVVLEPQHVTDYRHELVWVTAHTKTTLKGFGRQYWAHVGGTPLWQMNVMGGYRSGRAHTHGILAVVDDKHPLVVTGTGDIAYERRYPEVGEG